MKLTKDSDGNVVRDGDVVVFSYGIPPVRVEARVVEKNGRLVAITAPHKPAECELSRLKRLVGGYYKLESKAADPKEVEARIFADRVTPPSGTDKPGGAG